MKKTIKSIKLAKVAAIMLSLMLGLQFEMAGACAATQDWSIRYVKEAPTSESKSTWSKHIVRTKSTTKITVNKVGGGARIHATTENDMTSNGIDAYFTGKGSVSCGGMKKNAIIYAKIKYVTQGTSSNYPSGKIEY